MGIILNSAFGSAFALAFVFALAFAFAFAFLAVVFFYFLLLLTCLVCVYVFEFVCVCAAFDLFAFSLLFFSLVWFVCVWFFCVCFLCFLDYYYIYIVLHNAFFFHLLKTSQPAFYYQVYGTNQCLSPSNPKHPKDKVRPHAQIRSVN